jgi:hypothetical protein
MRAGSMAVTIHVLVLHIKFKQRRARSMAEEEENLPSKNEALISNSNTVREKEKRNRICLQ